MRKSLNGNAGAQEKDHDSGDGKTPNKIPSLPSHSRDVISDATKFEITSVESSSSRKQFTHHLPEIQGINMLGVIHQKTKALKEIETFRRKEKETDDKRVHFNLKSDEVCAKQYLTHVKSSDKSNLLRSEDQSDGSGNIENLTDGIGQSVKIPSEVNGLSLRGTTTLDGGTSEKSSDYSYHGKNVRIETQQNTSDEATHSEFSQSTNLPKQEISEIDWKLKCSIQMSNLMKELDNTDNELSEMIGAMLKTREKMIQDLDIFQYNLEGPLNEHSLPTRSPGAQPISAYKPAIHRIYLNSLHKGGCLMQKIKIFILANQLDIKTWESFREESKHLKERLIQHTSDCDSAYCNYINSELRHSMHNLWTQMKKCRQCRNNKDEEFLRFQIVCRTFLGLARILRGLLEL